MRIDSDLITRFSASTVHLEHITTALACLTPFGVKEDVLIYIDKDGISFVRENSHVIMIQLLLSKELFMTYSYQDDAEAQEEEENTAEGEDHMKLCVKINHILDSVSIANRNPDDIVECTISYDGNGSPFVLIFEDSMISERVEYSTYLIKDMDNSALQLSRNEVILECIVKGDVLYNALKDLKEINCKECYIYAKTTSDGENILALISKSQLGFSKIILPSSRSILEKLEIYENDSSTIISGTPVIGFFDFTSFDKIRMSCKIASKVLLRMDVHGLLSVNILSQTDNVVISDPKSKSNNTGVGTSIASRQIQLPKDYPGIVIEICMLEKESIDSISQQEIELLMNTISSRTLDKTKNIKRKRYAPIIQASTENSQTTNYLGLKEKKSESGDDEKTNQDESDNPYAPNSIPLFF